MWESLLSLQYENFNLVQSDIHIYRNLTLEFLKNSACQIPGTEDQAESDQWHFQRRFRITASTCKDVVKLGEGLSAHDSFHPHFPSFKRSSGFHLTLQVLICNMAKIMKSML